MNNLSLRRIAHGWIELIDVFETDVIIDVYFRSIADNGGGGGGGVGHWSRRGNRRFLQSGGLDVVQVFVWSYFPPVHWQEKHYLF